MTVALDAAYELDPRVALRPEPFGAMAYHFGNRRLSFLRSMDIVAVLENLSRHPSVADALRAAEVEESRWPIFTAALDRLAASEMIRVR